MTNLVEGVYISLRLVAGGQFCDIVVYRGDSNDFLSKVNKSRKTILLIYGILYINKLLVKKTSQRYV
jgi:hypothetical protein